MSNEKLASQIEALEESIKRMKFERQFADGQAYYQACDDIRDSEARLAQMKKELAAQNNKG